MSFKQRKFRTKTSFDDEEDGAGAPQAEDAGAAAKAPPAAAAAATKEAVKKATAKAALLSFEDDAEPDEDVPKPAKKEKGRGSKFGAAPIVAQLPSSLAPTQAPSAGEYTAERLKELQKNALSFSSKAAGAGGGGGGGGSEPLIKLSGSFKASFSKDDRFELTSSTAMVGPKPAGSSKSSVQGTRDEDEDDAMPLPPPPRPGAAPGSSTAPPGAAAEESSEEDGDGGDFSIPDENTIKLAKAKRERLRQAHLAPDYIPLGGAAKLTSRDFKALPDDRGGGGGEGGEGGEGGAAEPMQRCADSDEEAELEEVIRLKFVGSGGGGGGGAAAGGGASAKAGAKAARAVAIDKGSYSQVVAETEEDEAFAEEQLRKAIRRSQATMASTTGGRGGGGGGGTAAAASRKGGAGGGAVAEGEGVVGRSRTEQVKGLADGVLRAMQEALQRIQVGHRQSAANLQRTSDNLAACLQRIAQMEKDAKVASEKYVVVQRFRGYVADLCDCLAHKSVLVEELQDALTELMEQRASAAAEHVKATDSELMRLAEAAATAAMGVLAQGGAAEAARSAAEAAAAAAEQQLLGADLPVELDEFGRNVNLQKKRELAARAKGRAALVEAELAAATRFAGGDASALERGAGVAVAEDPALAEEAARYASRRAEVLENAATVFADADEEFATLAAVRSRLEEFKAALPRDYQSAYLPLSVPALMAPFVRLELLSWDPMFSGGGGGGSGGGSGGGGGGYRSFDQHAWYQQLFDYGISGAASDGAPAPPPPPPPPEEDDPDSELVPQLVRKLVLPLAGRLLDRCWEAADALQAGNAAAMVGDLLVYVPPGEERMVEILDLVREKLQSAVAAVSVPPWPSAVVAAAPLAEAVLFRRFRDALHVLRGLCAFAGVLPAGLLQQLALQQLACGQLLPYLRSALSSPLLAAMRLEALLQPLPETWFAAGPLREAAPLAELLVGVGRSLSSQSQPAGTTTAQSAPLAAAAGPLARRLVVMLTKLGEVDKARHVAMSHGFTI